MPSPWLFAALTEVAVPIFALVTGTRINDAECKLSLLPEIVQLEHPKMTMVAFYLSSGGFFGC